MRIIWQCIARSKSTILERLHGVQHKACQLTEFNSLLLGIRRDTKLASQAYHPRRLVSFNNQCQTDSTHGRTTDEVVQGESHRSTMSPGDGRQAVRTGPTQLWPTVRGRDARLTRCCTPPDELVTVIEGARSPVTSQHTIYYTATSVTWRAWSRVPSLAASVPAVFG